MQVIKFGIALYDLSISDVTERKAKRIEYGTVKKASAVLGVSESVLRRAAANKDRLFIHKLWKEFAVRHINKE